MTNSYTSFVGEVQHRIQAPSQAEAVRTTRAVLETLGERVDEGGATDIAGSLPQEIDYLLLRADHGQIFDYDEFIDRVVSRMNYDDLDLETKHGKPGQVDRADAVFQAKAVVELLTTVVPGGKLANVENQLPPDYDDLFEFVGADTHPWDQRD